MSASELRFVCDECRIQYPDRTLLKRHKQKFCKASKITRRRKTTHQDEDEYHQEFLEFHQDTPLTSDRSQRQQKSRQSSISASRNSSRMTSTPPGPQHRKHRHTPARDVNDKIAKLREKREILTNEMHQIQQVIDSRKDKTNNSAIVSEINDMRDSYLRVGGNDPNTMSRLNELETRALELRNARQRRLWSSDARTRSSAALPRSIAPNLLADRTSQAALVFRTYEQQAEAMRRDHKLDLMLTEMRAELNHLSRSRLREDVEGRHGDWRKDNGRHSPHRPKSSNLDELPLLFQRPAEQIQSITSPKFYDPNEGFGCFFDYVTSTPSCHMTVRLVTALYNADQSFRDPSVMRKVKPSQTSVIYDIGRANTMVLGYHLSLKHIPNSRTMSMVIELQLADPGMPLISKAWCKMPLFDNKNNLISGNWRLKFRKLPITPAITLPQLNIIEQFNEMELFYRIVDSDSIIPASGKSLVTNDLRHYHYLSQKILPDILDVPPPPSVTPPLINSDNEIDNSVGFQIISVRGGGLGKAKIKITVYHRSTGEIAQYPGGPVTCDSAIVSSSFAWNRHEFGRQVALFRSLRLTSDLVAVVRFYITGPESRDALSIETSAVATSEHHGKSLVAWSAIPLTKGNSLLNCGLHVVQLFKPPVPTVNSLPLRKAYMTSKYARYRAKTTTTTNVTQRNVASPTSPAPFSDGDDEGDTDGHSRVKLRIFENSRDDEDILSSDVVSDDDDNSSDNVLPSHCWLLYDRSIAPVEPFLDKDGFDLYIDACRYLPVACTITRVTCTLFDRNFSPLSCESGTSISLDSQINCPVYGERVEFRGHCLPCTATLLFKIYTMDRNSMSVIVGYSTLNVFTESGTFNQPSVDTKGIQISLNDGGHQIRVYSLPPGGADPFCESSLRTSANRIVPCASLLVRLCKAPLGIKGETLESRDIPRSDWEEVGLWKPRQEYSERVYYSTTCRPSKGETRIFNAFETQKFKNSITSVKIILKKLLSDTEYRALNSVKKTQAFIRNQLTKLMDLPSISLDLSFVVPYSPKCGLKVSVDCALNLPWQNFSMVTTCLSPPGAFYKGFPYTTYDKLIHTNQIDLNSTSSCPIWLDGYKNFPHRNSHEFLVVICHIHDVSVTQDSQGIAYKLLRQAWTACQVFTSGYVGSRQLQLPLYEGAPQPRILQQMTSQPCLQCLDSNASLGNLTYVKRASLVVRLCDARRDDELQHFTLCDKPQVSPDLDYLPDSTPQNDYKWLPGDSSAGRPLLDLVPQQLNPQNFLVNLGERTKKLINQAYTNES